jgi:Transposase DDE domain
MTTCTRSALSMLTDFFSSDDIEATARRTGFVNRASKLTGKRFLALVTFGAWRDATTTLAQWAAKVTQWDEQVEVSPEAIHQRMNRRALAFLQDMLRQALAKVQSLEKVCDAGLFTSFTKGYRADRTGCGLPESLHDILPGSGGSAAKAGAKIQAVWDYTSSVCGHLALTPWHIPDQKDIDQVVALAQKGVWLIFDLGYFQIQALARLATAGAYFLTRLNHQTTIFAPSAGGMQPVELTQRLQAVEGHLTERDLFIGAKELVPSRLVAVRMPESIVNARRSIAPKTAKKKGDSPSKAHLNL